MNATVKLIRSSNNNDKVYQTMAISFPIPRETLIHCKKIIGNALHIKLYRELK